MRKRRHWEKDKKKKKTIASKGRKETRREDKTTYFRRLSTKSKTISTINPIPSTSTSTTFHCPN